MTDTMKDRLDDRIDHIEIGADDPRFAIEVSDNGDGLTGVILFVESLQFHAEYLSDVWAEISEDENYLTAQAMAELGKSYSSELSSALDETGSILYLDYDSADVEDYPEIEISIPVSVRDGETVEDFLDRTYPIMAILINITDPGTFGSQYVFSTLIDLH